MQNKLLSRQIKKFLGEKANDPQVKVFIEAVGESYDQYERDKILTERSLAISSEEMRELNSKLTRESREQKLALRKLHESLRLLNYHSEKHGDLESNIVSISENIKKESERRIIAEEKLRKNVSDLEKTNKDLDQFAYVVSHDLKAPLRAIASLAEWIEEDAGEQLGEEVKNNLKILRGRVQRMENLIHGILAYTKAGKLTGEQNTINTSQYLQEIIDLINPPPSTKITITGDWPIIKTDTIRLHQVFSNLISNAIKYQDKPMGEIHINCTILEDHCQFSVKDNGPGIEKEYHQKIFGLFQTLAARDHIESTGIGLSIVQKIIEEQGGKIWLESKVGEGAKFTFTWPAKSEIKNTINI